MEAKPDTIEEPRGVSRPMASSLAIMAGLIRLVKLIPNLQPVGALGLFGGARLRSWHAFVLPIAVMVVSDILIKAIYYAGTDFPIFYPLNYVSFLFYVLIGRLVSRTESPWLIGGACLLGSVQFYLITNFGAWLQPELNYTRDLQGLLRCYILGIPFFGLTLLGDFGFSAILFGAHAWLSRTAFPRERVLAVPATR